MHMNIQNIGAVSVIKPTKALSTDHLHQCRLEIDHCLANRRSFLILDLAASPVVDSVGLEFIVDAQQKCLSRGGKLVVADPQPLCREVLEMTGVAEYVAIFPDMRSALTDFVR